MQHDLQQHDWPAGERGFYFSGEPEKGLPLGEEAVERARRLGDDVLLGGALMHWADPGGDPSFASGLT
jgi:hypothetical protein